MESVLKIFFLLLTLNFKNNSAENLLSILEGRFEMKFNEYTNYMTKSLEDFNDRHLINSVVGKMIKYDVLKPKFGTTMQNSQSQGKNMKKMTIALIPLIFHVGAASTWILLTGILAAKSVAIGLALLVFKIAVSSAKVASFFTSLKAKQGHGHYHDYSWAPQYNHYGHERSLLHKGNYPTEWYYTPEIESSPYKSIPIYKSQEHIEEFTAETKKEPVASFFTSLKAKQEHSHHHGYSWTPQYDHYGHDRSLLHKDNYPTEWYYTPEIESSPYKSISIYKSQEHIEEFTAETKKEPVSS